MTKKVGHPPAQPPRPSDPREVDSRKHTALPKTTSQTKTAPDTPIDTFTTLKRAALAPFVVGAAMVGFAAKKIQDVAEPMLGEARHSYQRMRLARLQDAAKNLPPVFSNRVNELVPDLDHFDSKINQDAIGKDLDEAAYLIGEYQALGQLPLLNGLSDTVSEKYQAAFADAVGNSDTRLQSHIGERHQLINQFYHIQEQGKKFDAPVILKQRVGELTAAGDLDNPLAEVQDQTKFLAASMGVANLTELYRMTSQVKSENKTAGVVKVADATTAWATDQLTTKFADYWNPQNIQTLDALATQRGKALNSAVALDYTHYETEAAREKMYDSLAAMDAHAALVIRYTETVVTPREEANKKRKQLDPRSGFKTAWQLEYTGPGWGGVLADKVGALKALDDFGKAFGINDLAGDTLNDNPLTRTYQAMKTSGNPFDVQQARLAEEASHLFMRTFNKVRLPEEEIALATEADWSAFAAKTDHDATLLAAINGVMRKAEDSLPKPAESFAEKRVSFVINANRLFGVENRAGGHATDDQLMRSHYTISANMINVMREQYRYGISKEYAEKYLAFFNDETAPMELRRMGATVYEYYLIQGQKREEDHRVRDAGQSAFDEVKSEANMLAVETGGDGGSIYGGNTWYDTGMYKAPNQIASKGGELMAKIERLEATNSLLELRTKYAGSEKYGVTGMAQLLREYGGEHRNVAEKTLYVLAGWVKYRYAELDEKYDLTQNIANAMGVPIGMVVDHFDINFKELDPATLAKIHHVNDMVEEIDQALFDVEQNQFARLQMVNQVDSHGTTFHQISEVTKEAQEVIVYRDMIQDIEIMAVATALTGGVGAELGLATRTGTLANDLVRAARIVVRVVGKQGTFLHVNALGKLVMRGKQDLYVSGKGFGYNGYNVGVQILEFELMGNAHNLFKSVWKVGEAAQHASKLRTFFAKSWKFGHEVVRDTAFFHSWTPAGSGIRGFAHADINEIAGGFESLTSLEGLRHTLVFTLGMGVPIGHPISARVVKFALEHKLPELKQVAERQSKIAAIEKNIEVMVRQAHHEREGEPFALSLSKGVTERITELRQQQQQLADHNQKALETLLKQYPESEELKQHAMMIQQSTMLQQQSGLAKFNLANARHMELGQKLGTLRALRKFEAHAFKRATIANQLHLTGLLPADVAVATQVEATHIRTQRLLMENAAQIQKLETSLNKQKTDLSQIPTRVTRLALAYQNHIALMEEANAITPNQFPTENIEQLRQQRVALLESMPKLEDKVATEYAEAMDAGAALHGEHLNALAAQSKMVSDGAAAKTFMDFWKQLGDVDSPARKMLAQALLLPVAPLLGSMGSIGSGGGGRRSTSSIPESLLHIIGVNSGWINEGLDITAEITKNPQRAAGALLNHLSSLIGVAAYLNHPDPEMQNVVRSAMSDMRDILGMLKQLPPDVRPSDRPDGEPLEAAFIRALNSRKGSERFVEGALRYIDSQFKTQYSEILASDKLHLTAKLSDLDVQWSVPEDHLELPDNWPHLRTVPEEMPRAAKMVKTIVASRARELGSELKDVRVVVAGVGRNAAEVLIWLRAGAQVHVVEPEEGAIAALEQNLSIMGIREDEQLRLTTSNKKMDSNTSSTADIVAWNFPRNANGLGAEELYRGLKPGGLLVVQTDYHDLYVEPFTHGDQSKGFEAIFSRPLDRQNFILPSGHLSMGSKSDVAIFRRAPVDTSTLTSVAAREVAWKEARGVVEVALSHGDLPRDDYNRELRNDEAAFDDLMTRLNPDYHEMNALLGFRPVELPSSGEPLTGADKVQMEQDLAWLRQSYPIQFSYELMEAAEFALKEGRPLPNVSMTNVGADPFGLNLLFNKNPRQEPMPFNYITAEERGDRLSGSFKAYNILYNGNALGVEIHITLPQMIAFLKEHPGALNPEAFIRLNATGITAFRDFILDQKIPVHVMVPAHIRDLDVARLTRHPNIHVQYLSPRDPALTSEAQSKKWVRETAPIDSARKIVDPITPERKGMNIIAGAALMADIHTGLHQVWTSIADTVAAHPVATAAAAAVAIGVTLYSSQLTQMGRAKNAIKAMGIGALIAEKSPNPKDPIVSLNAFLRGELGREPTLAEVRHFENNTWEFLERRDVYGMNASKVPQIYQIYNKEFVDALAARIATVAQEFRATHDGRNPRIVEIAGGDGRLARSLRSRGIDVTATDNHAWRIGPSDAVAHEDWTTSVEHADIILGSWLPPSRDYKSENFDVPIAQHLIEHPEKTYIQIEASVTNTNEFKRFVSGSEERGVLTIDEPPEFSGLLTSRIGDMSSYYSDNDLIAPVETSSTQLRIYRGVAQSGPREISETFKEVVSLFGHQLNAEARVKARTLLDSAKAMIARGEKVRLPHTEGEFDDYGKLAARVQQLLGLDNFEWAKIAQRPQLIANTGYDRHGRLPSLVGTIPGLTPELEAAFNNGAFVIELTAGKYVGRFWPDPESGHQPVDPKVGASLTKVYAEWRAKASFVSLSPEESQKALDKVKSDLAPYGITFSATQTPPATQFQFISDLLALCPAALLKSGVIKKIHIGREQGGYYTDEAGLFKDGELTLFKSPVNLTRAGMAFMFLHEAGHGVENMLTPVQRAKLEPAWDVIVKSKLGVIIPESPQAIAMGGVAERGQSKIDVFTEFIAETNAGYVLAGEHLRQEIGKIQDPKLRAAYESVYAFFKQLHEGREFGLLSNPNPPAQPHARVPYFTRLFSLTSVAEMPAPKASRTIIQELRSLLKGFSDLDAYTTGNIPQPEVNILETRGERMLALLQDIEQHTHLSAPVNGEPVASVLEGYLRVYYDSVRNKPLLEKTMQFIDDHSVAWLGKRTAYADTVRAFGAADAHRAESRNDAFDNAIILNYVRLSRKRRFGSHDNAAIRLELQQHPSFAIHALQPVVTNDLLIMHRPPIVVTPEATATSLLVVLRAIERYPDMPRPEGGPPGESAVAAYLRKAYQDNPMNHAEINRSLKDVDALAKKLMDVEGHFFEMGAPYRRTESVELPQPEPMKQVPPEEGVTGDQSTQKLNRVSPLRIESVQKPPKLADVVVVAPRVETPSIGAAPAAQIQTAMARNREILSGNHGFPATHYSYRNFQSLSSSLGSPSTPNAAYADIPGYVSASDGTIVALTRGLPVALEPSKHLLIGVTLHTFDPGLHPALSEVYMQLMLGDLDVHSQLPDHVLKILQREPAGSPLHQAYRAAEQEAGGSIPTIGKFFRRRVSAVDAAGVPAEVSAALASLVGTPVVANKPKPGAIPPELPPLPPPLAPVGEGDLDVHYMAIFPDVKGMYQAALKAYQKLTQPTDQFVIGISGVGRPITIKLPIAKSFDPADQVAARDAQRPVLKKWIRDTIFTKELESQPVVEGVTISPDRDKTYQETRKTLDRLENAMSAVAHKYSDRLRQPKGAELTEGQYPPAIDVVERAALYQKWCADTNVFLEIAALTEELAKEAEHRVEDEGDKATPLMKSVASVRRYVANRIAENLTSSPWAEVDGRLTADRNSYMIMAKAALDVTDPNYVVPPDPRALDQMTPQAAEEYAVELRAHFASATTTEAMSSLIAFDRLVRANKLSRATIEAAAHDVADQLVNGSAPYGSKDHPLYYAERLLGLTVPAESMSPDELVARWTHEVTDAFKRHSADVAAPRHAHPEDGEYGFDHARAHESKTTITKVPKDLQGGPMPLMLLMAAPMWLEGAQKLYAHVAPAMGRVAQKAAARTRALALSIARYGKIALMGPAILMMGAGGPVGGGRVGGSEPVRKPSEDPRVVELIGKHMGETRSLFAALDHSGMSADEAHALLKTTAGRIFSFAKGVFKSLPDALTALREGGMSPDDVRSTLIAISGKTELGTGSAFENIPAALTALREGGMTPNEARTTLIAIAEKSGFETKHAFKNLPVALIALREGGMTPGDARNYLIAIADKAGTGTFYAFGSLPAALTTLREVGMTPDEACNCFIAIADEAKATTGMAIEYVTHVWASSLSRHGKIALMGPAILTAGVEGPFVGGRAKYGESERKPSQDSRVVELVEERGRVKGVYKKFLLAGLDHSGLSADEVHNFLTSIADRVGTAIESAFKNLPVALTTLREAGMTPDEARDYLIAIADKADNGTGSAFKNLPVALTALRDGEMTPNEARSTLIAIVGKAGTNTGDAFAALTKLCKGVMKPSEARNYLIAIADEGGTNTGEVFRNIPPMPKAVANTIQDRYLKLLGTLTDYNQTRVLHLFGESTRAWAQQMPAEVYREYVVLTVAAFERHPRLGMNVLEGVSAAIKSGILPENSAPDSVGTLKFISRTQGFIPVLYRDYQKRGDVVFEELDRHAQRITHEEMSLNDMQEIVAAHGDQGYDYLLGVIQRVSPTSGASFVKTEEQIGLLQKMLEAGDLRGHIPKAWKNRVETFEMEMGEYRVKAGEAVDPGHKIVQLLDRFRAKDTESKEKTKPEEITAALQNYIAAATLEAKASALDAVRTVLYRYAGEQDALREKIDRIQDTDYTTLQLLEQLFADKDNLQTMLADAAMAIPDAVFAGRGQFRPMQADVTPLVKALQRAWAIGGKSTDDKRVMIASMLKPYDPVEVQRRFVSDSAIVARLGPELVAVIRKNRSDAPTLNRKLLLDQVFAEPLQLIRGEKGKFEYQGTGSVRIGVQAVKGPAFGLHGLTSGVCIAPDVELWKNLNFKLLAIIDEGNNQVVGYVHAFEVTQDGKKYLTVPGINPAAEFLGTVKARDLYPRLMTAVAAMAEVGGYDAVLIPTARNIHSNRSDIAAEIKRAKYEVRKLSEDVQWNTVPDPYPFKEVFVAWERGKSGPHVQPTEPTPVRGETIPVRGEPVEPHLPDLPPPPADAPERHAAHMIGGAALMADAMSGLHNVIGQFSDVIAAHPVVAGVAAVAAGAAIAGGVALYRHLRGESPTPSSKIPNEFLKAEQVAQNYTPSPHFERGIRRLVAGKAGEGDLLQDIVAFSDEARDVYSEYKNPDTNRTDPVHPALVQSNFKKSFEDALRQRGIALSATPDPESAWLENGWYLTGHQESEGNPYEGRFYFAVRKGVDEHDVPTNQALFSAMNALVKAANARGIEIQFKTAATQNTQYRADGSVLYIHAKDQQFILEQLATINRQHLLRSEIPHLTVQVTGPDGQLLSGIGFAECPPSGDSFGGELSTLLNPAVHRLARAIKSGWAPSEKTVLHILAQALKQGGVDADQLPFFTHKFDSLRAEKVGVHRDDAEVKMQEVRAKAEALYQQHGSDVSKIVHTLGLDEPVRIELAKISAAQDGWGTALCIQNYGITNETALGEIARIAIAQKQKSGTQHGQPSTTRGAALTGENSHFVFFGMMGPEDNINDLPKPLLRHVSSKTSDQIKSLFLSDVTDSHVDSALLDKVLQVGAEKNLQAHGMDLDSASSLANIMITGVLQRGYVGGLRSGDTSYTAGNHGPLYIVHSKKFHPNPLAQMDSARFYSTRDAHLAYLVPNAALKTAYMTAIDVALSHGDMSSQEAVDVKSKLITYAEFIARNGDVSAPLSAPERHAAHMLGGAALMADAMGQFSDAIAAHPVVAGVAAVAAGAALLLPALRRSFSRKLPPPLTPPDDIPIAARIGALREIFTPEAALDRYFDLNHNHFLRSFDAAIATHRSRIALRYEDTEALLPENYRLLALERLAIAHAFPDVVRGNVTLLIENYRIAEKLYLEEKPADAPERHAAHMIGGAALMADATSGLHNMMGQFADVIAAHPVIAGVAAVAASAAFAGGVAVYRHMLGKPPKVNSQDVTPAAAPPATVVRVGTQLHLVIPSSDHDSSPATIRGLEGVEYRWHRGGLDVRDTREPRMGVARATVNDGSGPVELPQGKWHSVRYGDKLTVGVRIHTVTQEAPPNSEVTPPRGTTPPRGITPPRGLTAFAEEAPSTTVLPIDQLPPTRTPLPPTGESKDALNLRFSDGSEVALDFSVSPEKVIGHGRYGIDDASIAQQHAILLYRDGFLYIRDNGSPEGTFVNNRKVAAGAIVRLYENDTVRMGESKFRIHHPEGTLGGRPVMPLGTASSKVESQFRFLPAESNARTPPLDLKTPEEVVPFPNLPGVDVKRDRDGNVLIRDARDSRKVSTLDDERGVEKRIIIDLRDMPVRRNSNETIPRDGQWHPLRDGDVLFLLGCKYTVSIKVPHPFDNVVSANPRLKSEMTSLQDASSVADFERRLSETSLSVGMRNDAVRTVRDVFAGKKSLSDLPLFLQPVIEGIMSREIATTMERGYDAAGVTLNVSQVNPRWTPTEKAYHLGMAAQHLAQQIAESASVESVIRTLESSPVIQVQHHNLTRIAQQLRDTLKTGAIPLQDLPYDLGLRQKLRDLLEERRVRDAGLESSAHAMPPDRHHRAKYEELDAIEDNLYLRHRREKEVMYQVLERGRPLSLITRSGQVRHDVESYMDDTIEVARKLLPREMNAHNNPYTGEGVSKDHIETTYRLARMVLNAHANRPVLGVPSKHEQGGLVTLVRGGFGHESVTDYVSAQRVIRQKLEEMGPEAIKLLNDAPAEGRALILESYFGTYSHRFIPDPAAAFRLASWLGRSGIYREVAMSLAAEGGRFYGKISIGQTGSVRQESHDDILVMHTHPEEYTTESGKIMGYDKGGDPATVYLELGSKSRDSRNIVFSNQDLDCFLRDATRLHSANASKSVVYDPASRSYRNWVLHPFGGSEAIIQLSESGKPIGVTIRYAKKPGADHNNDYKESIKRLKIYCEDKLDLPTTVTEIRYDDLMASLPYALHNQTPPSGLPKIRGPQ